MRVFVLVLLLAGCAANPDSQPANVTPYVHGGYTAFGGAVLSR